MKFQVKHRILPHDGVIPGAAGHKKVVVERGTKVYTIEYGTKIFWAAYLDEETALEVAKRFEDTVDGRTRRYIPLRTLIEWNFKSAIPHRISRPKSLHVLKTAGAT